jgi:hypothetical protein
MSRRERIEAVIENPNDYALAYPCDSAETLIDDMYTELALLWAYTDAVPPYMAEMTKQENWQDDEKRRALYRVKEAYEADNE